jgi:hypothetical protein
MTGDIHNRGVRYPRRDQAVVWDGWFLLLERIDNASGSSQTVECFWGSDLSGTEQGAGGVGGLLAVSVDGQYYFPCYDHNGNVMAYVSESGGFVGNDPVNRWRGGNVKSPDTINWEGVC